jgi:hypothetical protein
MDFSKSLLLRCAQTSAPLDHLRAADDEIRVSRSVFASYTRAHGLHHGGGLFDGAITEALKTTKKSSWQASRAALLHCVRGDCKATWLSRTRRSGHASIIFEA